MTIKGDIRKTQKIQVSLMDAKQSQLRADYFKLRVESGSYKTRVVHKGGHDGPLMNEEELKQNEIGTMHRHIQLAEEHLEFAKSMLFE